MSESSSQMETKMILSPKTMAELQTELGGELRDGALIEGQCRAFSAQLCEVSFPTGDGGKAKIESAAQGNVIVAHSVITIAGAIGEGCRILLLHREQNHLITKGASVLTSGDPRENPDEVWAQKVEVEPRVFSFARMGLGYSSSPERTKGVHYLFDVWRALISADATVRTLKDHGTLLPPDEVLEAVKDKPLEKAIVEKVLSAKY